MQSLPMLVNSLISSDTGSAVTAYERGPATFALMFTRWMDGNSWSHPIMTSLATACMGGGKGWLHSSQISGFRHAQTKNPGPRTFVAIERLNYYVHRYQTEHKLLPGTNSSNNYNTATSITEGGEAPPLGWWLEVFCGYRRPVDMELSGVFIPVDKVEEYSRALGRMLRDLMIENDLDVIDDLSRTLHRHYPTREAERTEAVAELILGRSTYTHEDFLLELPALTQLSAALKGPTTEDALLEALKN
jgi:hypothetical protein